MLYEHMLVIFMLFAAFGVVYYYDGDDHDKR